MDLDDFKLNPGSLAPAIVTSVIGWAIVAALWWVLALINADEIYGLAFGSLYGLSGLVFYLALVPFLFHLWAGAKVVENDGGMIDGLIVGLVLGLAIWFSWVLFGNWLHSDAPDRDFDVLFDFIWVFLVVGSGATAGSAGFTKTIKNI